MLPLVITVLYTLISAPGTGLPSAPVSCTSA